MKFLILSLAITSFLVGPRAFAQEEFSCAIDGDSVAFNIEPGEEAMLMEAASGGAYGLSCQDIKTVSKGIKTATAVVIGVKVLALKYPKVAALVARAGIRLESNQNVLLVTIVGVAGVYYAYLKLDEASKICDQQEQMQKYQEMIDQRLQLFLNRPAPIRCEGAI